jgi:hypothetical protein
LERALFAAGLVFTAVFVVVAFANLPLLILAVFEFQRSGATDTVGNSQ